MSAVQQRSTWVNGWLQSEAATHDAIHVKKVYIDINDGNLIDGVLFSQIMFWHLPDKQGRNKLQVLKDDHFWIAKKYEDWYEECRINVSTVRKALKRIEDRGLIVTGLWKFDGAPTKHIRVNWAKFEELVNSDLSNRTNGFDLSGQMELTSEDRSITETTTETTKERKDPPVESDQIQTPVVVPKPEPTPTEQTAFKPIRSTFKYRIPPGEDSRVGDTLTWVERCRGVFSAWFNANGEHKRVNAGDQLTLERKNLSHTQSLVLSGFTGDDVRAFIDWTYGTSNSDPFWKDKHAPLPMAHIVASIAGWKADQVKKAKAVMVQFPEQPKKINPEDAVTDATVEEFARKIGEL